MELGLTKHMTQRSLAKLRRGLDEVHHIHNGLSRVNDVKVDHRCNLYRHIIARNHFLGWNRQRNDTQINLDHTRDEWRHQENSWPFRASQTTKNKDHTSFVLLHHTDSRQEQ